MVNPPIVRQVSECIHPKHFCGINTQVQARTCIKFVNGIETRKISYLRNKVNSFQKVNLFYFKLGTGSNSESPGLKVIDKGTSCRDFWALMSVRNSNDINGSRRYAFLRCIVLVLMVTQIIDILPLVRREKFLLIA